MFTGICIRLFAQPRTVQLQIDYLITEISGSSMRSRHIGIFGSVSKAVNEPSPQKFHLKTTSNESIRRHLPQSNYPPS